MLVAVQALEEVRRHVAISGEAADPVSGGGGVHADSASLEVEGLEGTGVFLDLIPTHQS